MKRFPIRVLYVVLVVILVGVRAPSVSAQEAPPAPEAPREEPRSARLYTLKNVTASAIAETLKELFADTTGQMSIGVDEASNSLIVSTTDERAREIEALVQQLDSPELHRDVDSRDQLFHVYQLKYSRAHAAAKTLAELMGGFAAAVDERTNALLVRATDSQHKIIRGVLETLDIPEVQADPEPGESTARTHRRLMFYWLASGPDFATNKLVPRHLLPVVDELEAMGIQNVQLVSRAVAALDGGNVSLHSTVDAGSYRSLDLVLDGRLVSGDEETIRLALNVRATHAEDVSHVESTITAPYDHFVVLGTSGLGALENAFVIQIQSVEAARKESSQRQ